MKRTRRLAWGLVPLAVLAGCTSTRVADPEPTVSASPASCVVAEVALGQPVDQEQAFTYVVLRELAADGLHFTVLRDEPIEPSIRWTTSPAPVDAEVLAAIQELPEPVLVTPRDNADAVDDFVAAADAPGSRNLGYSSVVTERRTVTVTCQGGGTAHGMLSTWGDPQIGAQSCKAEPPNADPPSASRAAYEEFCPTA